MTSLTSRTFARCHGEQIGALAQAAGSRDGRVS